MIVVAIINVVYLFVVVVALAGEQVGQAVVEILLVHADQEHDRENNQGGADGNRNPLARHRPRPLVDKRREDGEGKVEVHSSRRRKQHAVDLGVTADQEANDDASRGRQPPDGDVQRHRLLHTHAGGKHHRNVAHLLGKLVQRDGDRGSQAGRKGNGEACRSEKKGRQRREGGGV